MFAPEMTIKLHHITFPIRIVSGNPIRTRLCSTAAQVVHSS